MRIVPVTKLNLPTQNSKLYWNNVIDNNESEITKVRHSSLMLFPSLTIASAKRSARDDCNLNDSNTHMRNMTRELIVRVSSPTLSCNKRVSEIIPHDHRPGENTKYSKDYGIDNFELEPFHKEKFRDDIGANEEIDENIIDKIKNMHEMSDVKVNFSLSSKIPQLSKISGYVNDFLASTKVRIRSNTVSNKFGMPMKISESNSNRSKKNDLLSGQLCNTLSNKTSSTESLLIKNADRVTMECEQSKQSPESLKIYMDSQDKNYYNEEKEYWRFRRTRAPSIKVASTVPSFRKIRSLKNLNSIENTSINDNANTNNLFNEYLQSPTDFSAFPIHEGVMAEIPQNPLHMGRMRPCAINFHPYSSKHTVQSKSIPRELCNINCLKREKKFKSWPKQSIIYATRILERMKCYQVRKKKQENEIFHSSEPEEPSTNTTSSSTSYQSIRQRMRNNHSVIHKGMNDSITSQFISDMKDNSDDELVRTSMNTQNSRIETVLPKTEKDKSALVLDSMPQISAMYLRKKLDKCLACLHGSMKINPENESKILACYQNVNLSPPSNSQNLITHSFNIFSEVKALSEPHAIPAVEFSNNAKSSDVQTVMFENNRYDDNKVPFSGTNFHEDDSILKSTISSSSYRQLDQGLNEKSILSSKSFVSTLSLASERSKTASDRDDSDQALDEIEGLNTDILEPRWKFLVPCHAQTNWRPTFALLKALSGKKIRSIQSRMTSLEKIMDNGSDEESGDSEKLSDENRNKCSSLNAENEFNKSDEYPRTYDKSQSKYDEFDALGHNTINTSYTQLFKALMISNDICSQLNMNTNMSNYNPGESFRPVSPIISRTEVMEISRKSFDDNHRSIEILQILADEYIKRFQKTRSINPKSNVSNFNKREKIIKNLLLLLIDAKFHINFQNHFPHSQFYVKQKCPINSRQLRRALPVKSYNLIAPILGIPPWHPKHWSSMKDARKLKSNSRTVTTLIKHQKSQESGKSEFLNDIDLIVHPPSQIGSASSEVSDNSYRRKRLNPYANFFRKPRRKARIWRTLTEENLEGYNSEATLSNHASKVTDKIVTEFCQWMKSLDGFDRTLDEDVLENMFETDFTAEVCKTMQACMKEMPTVPTVVADIRNCPDAGEVEITRRQLRRDLKAEKKASSLIGFGTTKPQYLKFVPPRNHVKDHWLRCEYVPRDLETMDVVWKDITHLDSVKGFTEWLQTHSNIGLLNNASQI